MAVSDKNAVASSKSTCEVIEVVVCDWLKREASLEIDAVDYDAPLFDLGIDSLGAASIAAELEVTFQKTLKPEVVYELETIRELADYLDSLPKSTVRAAGGVASMPAASPLAPSDEPEEPAPSSGYNPIDHYARLNRKVNTLKEQGLYLFEPEISSHEGAWVQCEGHRMLMLASYEYLGLLGNEALNRAAEEALKQYGTGHHGSRLLTGTTSLHRKLESRLAKLMDAEDAIVFSSGYVANLATISALVGPGDYVIGDSMNHASIIDGCQMSGAEFSEFKHNDMSELAGRLEQCGRRRTLVIVDAIFSMEGDIINLPAVVELCKKHNALLMVDEAHSLGVLGKTGCGIQEHFGLAPSDIHIKMGTLSKSLAGSGGFVAGEGQIITYLRHHARGYIFSGALPAVYANVSLAALDVMQREPQRVTKIWENLKYYLAGLKRLGFDTGTCETPIVPIMTRTNEPTIAMTKLCRDEGLLVAPVVFPAVPMDAPRLRTCITAIHEHSDIDFALDVLARAGRQCGIIS
ncbi:MAG: aminotransferase class I/II-fold pyridoxal phosphate-dependent enzyme [Pirellulaceae bacterium]